MQLPIKSIITSIYIDFILNCDIFCQNSRDALGGIMNEKTIDELMASLTELLPPVVFRNFSRFRELTGFSSRTVANADALGRGPKSRVRIGRNVGYPRECLIEWLRERTKKL